MTGHYLAAYTFNEFLDRYQSDLIKGFREAEPHAFRTIEAAEGFIARSGYDVEPGPETWGTQVFPRYWKDNGDGFAPSTLSLWTSAEALMAATFHGIHGKAYRRGAEWHAHPAPWPNYALWWVAKDHQPDWAEAVRKIEHLGDHGPTETAFTFKALFDPEGRSFKPDTAKIKRLAASNQLKAQIEP